MDINVPQTRISEIIKGNRSITADTALRLSKYFGNSANF
jgi:addiction module HigA family antidote